MSASVLVLYPSSLWLLLRRIQPRNTKRRSVGAEWVSEQSGLPSVFGLDREGRGVWCFVVWEVY
jgi:hypothetical protein